MFRNTSLVFLGRRLVLLTVVALGQIVMAQEPAAPQQNSESAPVYNDDPMSLPPRTAPPPSSAEEPARPDSITSLRERRRCRRSREDSFSKSRCRKWFCALRSSMIWPAGDLA